MGSGRKPIVWLKGRAEIRTPPFSEEARIEAGTLLRRLQEGELFGMPHSRPMPGIGPRCHELRVRDRGHYWRIIYRVDPLAILVAEIFAKETGQTPKAILSDCRQRFRVYDREVRKAQAGRKAKKRKGDG